MHGCRGGALPRPKPRSAPPPPPSGCAEFFRGAKGAEENFRSELIGAEGARGIFDWPKARKKIGPIFSEGGGGGWVEGGGGGGPTPPHPLLCQADKSPRTNDLDQEKQMHTTDINAVVFHGHHPTFPSPRSPPVAKQNTDALSVVRAPNWGGGGLQVLQVRIS